MTYPEPKPLASLSGSLLARKGQAAPAMRRQNMMALATSGTPAEDHLEDLGWDDMGEDKSQDPASGGFAGLSPMAPSPVALAPVADEEPLRAKVPIVVHQQRVLAEEFAPVPRVEVDAVAPVAEVPVEINAPVVAPVAMPEVIQTLRTRAAPGSQGKAAFTLRLDAERHLKLRVVCALRHRSAQQIVTEALDAYLAKQPIPADLAIGSSPPRGMN